MRRTCQVEKLALAARACLEPWRLSVRQTRTATLKWSPRTLRCDLSSPKTSGGQRLVQTVRLLPCPRYVRAKLQAVTPATSNVRRCGVTQPTFRSDGYFVCGTEIQGDEPVAEGKKASPDQNKLVFSKADFEEGCLAKRDDGTTCVWTYPLNEVRPTVGEITCCRPHLPCAASTARPRCRVDG